jgi:mannose-1-phosphate guanylyltransferase/mannose-6-phosphate isomerase
MALIPVILAGGRGARLWPLSRKLYPKQFINLVSNKSMFQDTLGRLEKLSVGEPIIICGEAHRFFIAEQLEEIGLKAKIVLEPVGRNTAPAITVAANLLEPCDTMLVLPADHYIKDVDAFLSAVKSAYEFAQDDYLLTFGVTPTSPNTGYGYIEIDSQLGVSRRVKRFVEKPDKEKALSYIKAGNFLWNSGMFVFKVDTFLDEMSDFAANIMDSAKASVDEATIDSDFIRLGAEAFSMSPEGSIDYILLEKTKKLLIIELDVGWSDLGSWDSIADLADADEHGNILPKEAVPIDTSSTYVKSVSDKVIATIGVSDLIIIDTEDALLVANKNSIQDIKRVVEKLEANNSEVVDLHRKVYRPWGWFDNIDSGDNFKVKRIRVNPGAKLSLQKHSFRAEHWIVVKGIAEVTCDGENFLLRENESTYIPLGGIHRLANPGSKPLEIIEVQSGTYFGEDDIIRYEDDYHRH